MDKRLIGEARLARFAFGATVGLSLLGGLLIVGQALLLSRIISRAFLAEAGRSELTGLFVGLLLLVGLRALNQIGIQLTADSVAIRVKQALRRRLVTHLLKLGPAYTRQGHSGELALTASDGIEALDSYFRDYLPALFTFLLVPLVILLFVLPVDLLTFGVLLVTAPLIPIFMVLIGQMAGALAQNRYAQLGQLSAHFLDVMQGLTTLKLFNRSKAQIQIIARITDQYRQSTLAVLRVAFLSAFVLELVAMISIAVVAVEVGLRLLYGRILFEQALFLLVLAPDFYQPLRQLGARFHAGQDGVAAAQRIYAILNQPLPEAMGQGTVPDFTEIRFEAISVAFAAGERVALHPLSLTIKRGEHLALVGTTGSGKSTVANLLLRFVEPDNGRILLVNTDNSPATITLLNEVDADAWRATIGWVPQRGYLFNMSVADNIRLGREAAGDADIEAAAKAANADPFIRQLPQGYETLVGENGTRLSGGQAQRLTLARALIRRPDIYLFDEATASLDSDNERIILENLRTLTAGATVITIAHRLATVRRADRIVVLDNGRIVESGTHGELVDRRGAYFELLQHGET
jgi:ATP-binding cassette, subfamily C, bacterial CydD